MGTLDDAQDVFVDLKVAEGAFDFGAVPDHIWDRLVDDGDVNDPELVRLIRQRADGRPGEPEATGGRPSGRTIDTRVTTRHDVVAGKVDALNRLALRLGAEGRPRESETLLRRALVLGEVAYGPDAPEVAVLAVVLASTLAGQGRLAEAEDLAARAATGLGPVDVNPVAVATSAYRLAKALATHGRPELAAALYERTATIQRAALGADHPDVALTLHNLALLHNAAGRVDQAESTWAAARSALGGNPAG